MSDTTIFVTHTFVGFHRWADAPDSRYYLSERHRHRFVVTVEAVVEHDDRDIEFHDLIDYVTQRCEFLGQKGPGSSRELGGMSCEMIARVIVDSVASRWPGRSLMCEVSEDGEAGARVAKPAGGE